MKRLLTLCLLAALLCFCGGCTGAPLSRTAMLLDTTCTVTLYDSTDEALLTSCMTAIAADEQCWSRTDPNSDVSAVNSGGAVTVSEDTAALLATSLEWSTRTDGAFDITTAALTALWQTAEEQNRLPDNATLQKALDTVGAGKVTVDGNTVTCEDGTQLDLGAVAKGAIADRAAALLKDGGCRSALIDLGGNIVAVGSKPDGTPFHIGIADPQNPDALVTTVAVTDMAVVTSGSYERGYKIADAWYSHILDPRTGHPVSNDLLSVTILSPSSTEADVLSTACFVLGYNAAAALIDSLPDTDAVFVLADGRVVTTDGVQTVF